LPDDLLVILAQNAHGDDAPFAEIELRHIYSSSAPSVPNCYPHRGAQYMLDVVAGAATPPEVAALRRRAHAFRRTVEPYASGLYLNLADTSAAAQAFDPAALRRLQAVKRQFDPDDLFISGYSLS
jgi:FAD/FMN-containing dehydrogenase